MQSKCIHLPTDAHWYVSNSEIHEDLGVPLFANHIRALTESIDSKLADVGNPQYGNSADIYADRGLTPSLKRKPRAAGDRRPVESIACNGKWTK